MRVVLTPVFGALVKFGMAPKMSLWVRSVPPAALHVLAMMAAIPLVRGPALSGFGPHLICRDAFDADGLRVREGPCFGPC